LVKRDELTRIYPMIGPLGPVDIHCCPIESEYHVIALDIISLDDWLRHGILASPVVLVIVPPK
jgi:hypothetical protein